MLATLLEQNRRHDPRLLVGPRVGEDAAVIDMGAERLLLAKSDPITFATDAIGHYAVTVNANDIATMGGTPRWFLATLLLPETGTTSALVHDIFAQIHQACEALDITLAGGHTEITVGLSRPILSGHMLGDVPRDRLVTSAGGQVGDAIMLTKGFPLEGITIMARECADLLAAHGFPQADIARWQQLLFTPGISVVRDAHVLHQAVDVHAMHDPTEGGLASGLHELAQASGVGLHIFSDCLPILDAGSHLCTALGLDPLGTIASGALLALVPAAHVDRAIGACAAADIACYHIGTVVENPSERLVVDAHGSRPLPTFARDEIVRLFETEESGAQY
jgi:hydrogenase maturation factor